MQAQRINYRQVSEQSNYFIPFRSDSFENSLRKYESVKKKINHDHNREFLHHHYQNCRQNISKEERIKFYKQNLEREKERSREKVRLFRQKIRIIQKKNRSTSNKIKTPYADLESAQHNQTTATLIQEKVIINPVEQEVSVKTDHEDLKSEGILSVPQQLSAMDILQNLPQTSTEHTTPIKMQQMGIQNGQLKFQKTNYRISLRIIDKLYKRYGSLEKLIDVMLEKRPHLLAVKQQLQFRFQKYFQSKQTPF